MDPSIVIPPVAALVIGVVTVVVTQLHPRQPRESNRSRDGEFVERLRARNPKDAL